MHESSVPHVAAAHNHLINLQSLPRSSGPLDAFQCAYWAYVHARSVAALQLDDVHSQGWTLAELADACGVEPEAIFSAFQGVPGLEGRLIDIDV